MRLSEVQYWKRRAQLNVVSYGKLSEFTANPYAYRQNHDANHGGDPTDAMVRGGLVDAMLFQPEALANFHDTESDEWRTNAVKARVADARAKGLIPVRPKQIAEARAIVRAIHTNKNVPNVHQLVIHGTPQQGIAHELLPGLVHVSKPDWAPARDGEWGEWLFDLKVTNSLELSKWEAKVAQYKYHWQAASYLDEYNAETGERRSRFGWIIVEDAYPHDCGIVECAPAAMEIGLNEWSAAVKRYYTALITDTWPSPLNTGGEPLVAGLPRWYKEAT